MKKKFLLLLFSLPLLFFASGQYITNGHAISLGGNCFRLTPDEYTQGGSVWFQNKISLASDFTVDATVYLGDYDGGADGLAFVLQPVCSGLGSYGGGLGYQGISPSLAVELDTWQNSDPPEDHIGLMMNGNVNHTFPNPGPNVPQGFAVLPNIENGVSHTLKIEWLAGPQNLKVTFDGILRINYTADIVANIFGGNRNVFWGFTAATGAAKNEHRVCINSSGFTEEGSFTVTKPSCPAYNNGAIDLNPAGGVGPFTYLWSNGVTTEDLTGITAGTYNVIVTDGNGCKSVFSIPVVNELDNTPPVIACPADITVSNDPGKCGAKVNYPAITATDNCCPVSLPGYNYYGVFGGHTYFTSNATVTWPVAKAAAAALGGHLATVTSAAENAFLSNNTLYWIGLTDEVQEGSFKWITGEPLGFTSWGAGEPNNSGNEDWVEINRFGSGMWNDLPAGITRQYYVEFDCITIQQTAGLPSGSEFPVGKTTNTFVATDASGNTATCSFDVTVTDDEAPLAKCKPFTVTLSGGAASITADDVNDGSSDNCGIQSITASILNFDCSNIGDNNVTLTVTDIAGHVSSCTAVVTVVGEIPTCSITSVPSSSIYTGGVSTNLYLGYGAQSTTLQVSAPASGEPYTYAWSGGTLSNYNTADPVFTATTAGSFTFTVLVTNKYGCTTSCSISICVTDVRVPGTDGKKVYVCHIPPGNPGNPQTLSISVNAVPAHVGLHGGDRLGTCDMQPCTAPTIVSRKSAMDAGDAHGKLEVTVAPNPTSSHFTFRLHSENETPVTIRIVNGTGQVLESAHKVNANSTVQMGGKLLNGMYFAEFMQGSDRQVIKVMKIGTR